MDDETTYKNEKLETQLNKNATPYNTTYKNKHVERRKMSQHMQN